MRKDHRPAWLFKLENKINQWIINKKIRPQFSSLGQQPAILKPNSLQIFGEEIHGGNYLHLISDKNQPIKLSTWSSKQQQGKIHIGDYCLVSPGVNITAAQSISIGDNCMLAAECHISDSDWHGVYNRIRPFRCTRPITLENNVWLGLRSVVCKGVHIGENSVIGAGSVVVSDIPANVIAAGNPAKVVKTLNPKRKMLKRDYLFKGKQDYWAHMEEVGSFFCEQNSNISWLKSKILPSIDD